jgi:renalase
MAGLAAASALAAGGMRVRVFDKGRGPGGRMATRRLIVQGSELSFDHGAQFFTVRDPTFRSAAGLWLEAGYLVPWLPRRASTAPAEAWYVGQPGMSAVLRSLATGLDVSWSARVSAIAGVPHNWWLQMEDGRSEGPFSLIILAVPAEQAAPLLTGPAPPLCQAAQRVRTLPCWTLMLVFEPALGLEVDILELPEPVSAITWAARDASKPGRGEADAWVVQAGPQWSLAHLEDTPDAAAELLVAEFRRLTGAAQPQICGVHRWRFARVAEPLGTPFLHDRELGLATCGDWHLGARVEAAWLSGHQLAQDVLGKNGRSHL